MGREIRRVPPNWEHPRQTCPHSTWFGGCREAEENDGKCFKPMYDRDFETEIEDWYAQYQLWKKGEHPDQADYPDDTKGKTFWDWDGGPPDPEYHRPKWSEEEATWYQVYQTVSEGTPVTPPFATKEELVDYLVEHGDSWDQERGDGGWDRKNAEAFVKVGHAFSLVSVSRSEDSPIEILAPRDQGDLFQLGKDDES